MKLAAVCWKLEEKKKIYGVKVQGKDLLRRWELYIKHTGRGTNAP